MKWLGKTILIQIPSQKQFCTKTSLKDSDSNAQGYVGKEQSRDEGGTWHQKGEQTNPALSNPSHSTCPLEPDPACFLPSFSEREIGSDRDDYA